MGAVLDLATVGFEVAVVLEAVMTADLAGRRGGPAFSFSTFLLGIALRGLFSAPSAAFVLAFRLSDVKSMPNTLLRLRLSFSGTGGGVSNAFSFARMESADACRTLGPAGLFVGLEPEKLDVLTFAAGDEKTCSRPCLAEGESASDASGVLDGVGAMRIWGMGESALRREGMLGVPGGSFVRERGSEHT